MFITNKADISSVAQLLEQLKDSSDTLRPTMFNATSLGVPDEFTALKDTYGLLIDTDDGLKVKALQDYAQFIERTNLVQDILNGIEGQAMDIASILSNIGYDNIDALSSDISIAAAIMSAIQGSHKYPTLEAPLERLSTMLDKLIVLLGGDTDVDQ